MKIAFAGKGGVGKTTLCAWMGDWLARQGHNVWMLDADTALSLGQASGLSPADLPEPLVLRDDLIRERIGTGMLTLNPEVGDLPEALSVDLPVGNVDGGLAVNGVKPGRKRLLVMGTVTAAGGGCACEANALLKALLAHIVMARDEWVLVDLEAGVEHLGRGTVEHVDGLVVVSEPSRRGLETAASVGRLASDLGLTHQALVLNRYDTSGASGSSFLEMDGLPTLAATIPPLPGLLARQLTDGSVLSLPEQTQVDGLVQQVLGALR
jgi:CO dehydrogenase maturation factor